MKVAVVYVFPQILLPKYRPLAERFADTYMKYAPGAYPHTLYVVANGYGIEPRQAEAFGPLPVTHLTHSNYGKDIGAFIMAANTIECDLLVCLGSHVHFRRAGWLDRIVNVYLDNGPGLYGAWGFHQPALHLRTTAYWGAPMLLSSYPIDVSNERRYEFEHSPYHSIVSHTIKMGFPTLMVTWTGVYEPKQWHHVENHDCLMLDQHSDAINYT